MGYAPVTFDDIVLTDATGDKPGIDQAMFAAEKTLDSLADAGYQNGFEGLALSERVTHPANHGFPDATFDFIFAKGLMASQPTISRTNASDHWPVTHSFALH